MGATGLFLCLFLVAHLVGNLLLLKNDGGEAFNQYAEFMSTSPLIRVAEIILFLGFLFHILDALVLTRKNQGARASRYVMDAGSANSQWTSRNMGITGSIVLIFLVVHLNTFFVKHRIIGTPETMYDTAIDAFQFGWSGLYWAFYVVAMVLLGLHLNHGFQSGFFSLGLNHRKYNSFIKRFGLFFSILIPAGFAVIPIYFFFGQP